MPSLRSPAPRRPSPIHPPLGLWVQVKIGEEREEACICCVYGRKPLCKVSRYPGVAQLVARLLWEQDAAGSNPVTRTMSSVHNAFELWALDFSIFSYVEQAVACSFVMPSGGL